MACSAASPAPETPPSPTPSPSAATADPTAAACTPDGTTRTALTDWRKAGGIAPGIVPIIVSTHVSVGPMRLLYTVTDEDFEVLSAADRPTRLRLFALESDAADPVTEVEGTFLDTGTGRGLYGASVSFGCSGEWGAEIILDPDSEEPRVARTTFRVMPAGPTPPIGALAPRSDSLTAVSMEEVRAISTDPEPDPEAYRLSIAEAVTSGRPSVIFFATPAFCQSGVCGPTVEMVKAVMAEYRGRVAFVIVEPYQLQQTPNGLQPVLDEEGRLQPVEAVVDYGIPVEPYLFVVDRDGRVADTFEIVIGEDELRGALTAVLAG